MDSTANDLFNLLVGRDYTVKTMTNQGKPEINPAEAEMFRFDFETKHNNYGTVIILLDDEGNLEVYFGDNIGKNMEPQDKDVWYDFLYQLKTFATRNLMSFGLKNLNKLKYSMQGMAAINEGLFEGWNGTKRTSYNDKPGTTRLKIVHSRELGEGEQRFRNIEKLYVENTEGERFKLPFTTLVGGRAMARHVAEGGTPYDVFGQHITDMVREANILNKFVRATKTINEDDTEQYSIVEAGRERYQTVRSRLKSLAGKRGYHAYKESWSPEDLDEDEALVNALRGSFMKESIDERIDEALPWILKVLTSKPARKVYKGIAKYALPTAIGIGLANKYPLDKDAQDAENKPKVVQQQPEKKDTKESTMKEFDQFANWAENVTEGTWAIPDNDAKINQLKEILAEPLPVGVDAMNATNVLYDIIGDDDLFDSLAALADEDPQADARPIIEHWIELYTDSHPGLEDLADRVLGSQEELNFEEGLNEGDVIQGKFGSKFGSQGMNKYGMSAVKTAQGFFALKNGKVVAGPFDTIDELKAYQQGELNKEAVGEQLDIDTGKEQRRQERDHMLEMNAWRKLAGMQEKVYEDFTAFQEVQEEQDETVEEIDTTLYQDKEMTEDERAAKLNDDILDELNASELGKEGVDWFAPADTEPYDPERDDPRDDPNYGFDRKPTKPQAPVAPGTKKTDEGNAFSGALAKAKKTGAAEFEVDGKRYKVTEVDAGKFGAGDEEIEDPEQVVPGGAQDDGKIANEKDIEEQGPSYKDTYNYLKSRELAGVPDNPNQAQTRARANAAFGQMSARDSLNTGTAGSTASNTAQQIQRPTRPTPSRDPFGDLDKEVDNMFDDKHSGKKAKPDYLDFDKDGDRKESMKKALADKKKNTNEETLDEEFKKGDKVHLGLAVKGGTGIRGTIEKIEGDKVYIINPEGRKYSGRLKNLTKESIEEESNLDEAGYKIPKNYAAMMQKKKSQQKKNNDEAQVTKDSVAKLLVKYGNNPEAVEKMIEKEFEWAVKTYPQATASRIAEIIRTVAEDVELDERSLTKGEEKKREKYVKGMKKSKADFKKRYGDRGEEVMYATATKMAKEGEGETTGGSNMFGKGIYESLTELENDLDMELGHGITATSQLDEPKVDLMGPEEVGTTDIAVVAPAEPKEKNIGDKIADKGMELSASIDAALADIKRLAGMGN